MNAFKTMLLLAALTALFMSVGYMIAGVGGMLLALVIAVAMNFIAFWNSDKLVLRMHNAQAVTTRSHPDLFAMVAQLARNAGLPMPRIYLIPSEQPNAFATGRNPENAAVAVTSGILRALNPEELAGVLAHELAHIRNRDTLTMTIAATVAGAISMLAQFGYYLGRGRNRGGAGAVGLLLAVLFAPFAAMLIQMLISRTREYSADRGGAEIAGDPLALASALAKIASFAHRVEMPSAEANPASAHLFIINPLSGARMDNLFSTHPSVENRIAALQAMAPRGGSGPSSRHGTTGRSAVPAVTRRRGR